MTLHKLLSYLCTTFYCYYSNYPSRQLLVEKEGSSYLFIAMICILSLTTYNQVTEVKPYSRNSLVTFIPQAQRLCTYRRFKVVYSSLTLVQFWNVPPRRPMKDTCQWTTVVNLKMKNIPAIDLSSCHNHIEYRPSSWYQFIEIGDWYSSYSQ